MIKCPIQQQRSQPGTWGVPISLGSYSVRKILAHEDKGQSWSGGDSLQSTSGKDFP